MKLRDGEVIQLSGPLSALSRRHFCQAAGTGVAAAALAACGGNELLHITLGDISDGGEDNTGPLAPKDLSVPAPQDLRGRPYDLRGDLREPVHDLSGVTSSPDLAQPVAANCPAGVYDTGKLPAAVALNTAVYISAQDLFLCRDGNGLFGISSLCTHEYRTINFVKSTQSFRCPVHGATFAWSGNATGGPTRVPLDHYALCITAKGTLGVDLNGTTAASSRLVA